MKPQSDSPDSLVFECDFEEPPEKVWRALTEPQLLEAWLADESPRCADDSPQPADDSQRTDLGGETTVRRPRPADYEIVTAQPHRLLRYRCRDREGGVGDSGGREVHSVVTVELAPCPTGGTHLRLTHGEFRIVAVAAPMPTASVTPITSARRRRTPMVSCAMQASWRRAA